MAAVLFVVHLAWGSRYAADAMLFGKLRSRSVDQSLYSFIQSSELRKQAALGMYSLPLASASFRCSCGLCILFFRKSFAVRLAKNEQHRHGTAPHPPAVSCTRETKLFLFFV